MTAENSRSPTHHRLRRSWRFWFGSLLSLAALAWLIVTTDWAEAWTALVQANYWLVLAAAGLVLLTIPMRTGRWRLMFPPMSRPPFGRLTTIMLIGQAINLFVPMRLGDIVRSTLVETETAAFVLGTQMLRIALDLLILAGLVVVLLFQVSLPVWWRGPGEVLLVTSAMAFLGLAGLVAGRRLIARFLSWLRPRWPFPRSRRLLDLATEFLRSLDVFASPVLLLVLVAWSAVIWAFYVAVNYVLLQAVGVPAESDLATAWLASMFLLVVLQLGIAVPSSPGRVGVYHYLTVQALGVFGIEQATAVTYAILLHVITVIIPTILGALLAWQSGIGLRPTQQQSAG